MPLSLSSGVSFVCCTRGGRLRSKRSRVRAVMLTDLGSSCQTSSHEDGYPYRQGMCVLDGLWKERMPAILNLAATTGGCAYDRSISLNYRSLMRVTFARLAQELPLR